MAQTLYGVVTLKGNSKATLVEETTRHTSKTEFAKELRANGYKVKFVFNDADYDKVMDRIKLNGFHMMSAKDEMIYQIING